MSFREWSGVWAFAIGCTAVVTGWAYLCVALFPTTLAVALGVSIPLGVLFVIGYFVVRL